MISYEHIFSNLSKEPHYLKWMDNKSSAIKDNENVCEIDADELLNPDAMIFRK